MPAAPARPFLKWVGGKTRILGELVKSLPPASSYSCYVEPFLGGGGSLLGLLPHVRPDALIQATDANAPLINAWRAVQSCVDDVVAWMSVMQDLHSEEHYYTVRDRFNRLLAHLDVSPTSAPDPLCAAEFIYLNRACFNGLWRVGRDGTFNVPKGTATRVLFEEDLRSTSVAVRNVSFSCRRIESFPILPHSLFYFDPPYDRASAKEFTSYTKEGFGREAQFDLYRLCVDLDRCGSLWMQSNADTPWVRSQYAGFNIRSLSAPRSVAASGSRSRAAEVLVTNY